MAMDTAAQIVETEWLDAACLGGALPVLAEAQLRLAGMNYQQDAVAERHLQEAEALAPGHPAVLIGKYRFYFYKGRLREALDVARTCLRQAAHDNGLVEDWHQVRNTDAEFDSYDAIRPRFYLFTLKAYAYLQMRLGDVAEGANALAKLMELDPGDKLGGSVLFGVLQRQGRDDDDE